MHYVLIAVLITLCVNFGVRQRYMPFASVITPRQKRLLYGSYMLLAVINLAALIAAQYIWKEAAAFTYLRFGGIVYAIILTLVNILVIPGRTREQLFVFGVVLICNYQLMSVPNYLIAILPVSGVTENLFLVLVSYAAVLLLTHEPLIRLLRNTVEPFLLLVNDEYWDIIWYMPIALFFTRAVYLGGEHNLGGIAQLFSSMLYIIVVVLMCKGITTDYQHVRERKVMEMQLVDQKLHYAELKVRVEEAQKAKHDFKHHVAAICHYIEMDDLEGLRGYCDELIARDDTQIRIPYTGNAAADGVLYYYMRQAEQAQVDFECSGVICSNGIADVDLSVLLGNALDNALTACMTIPEGRKIRVISHSEEQLLSIAVHNTFDGKIKRSRGGLLSFKRENGPGIGLSSMQSVCKRYGGSMETRWDEHSFTVMFVLPITGTE